MTTRYLLRAPLLVLLAGGVPAKNLAWVGAPTGPQPTPRLGAVPQGKSQREGMVRPYGIDVRDYGARGNGVHDDTAAFQAAIQRALVNSDGSCAGERIFVPKGTFRICDTIVVEEAVGITFTGAGQEATRLVWDPRGEGETRWQKSSGLPAETSAASTAVLLLRDSRNTVFENFSIVNPDGDKLNQAIRIESVSAEHQASSCNVFRSIEIDGGPDGLERGVTVGMGGDEDSENSGHVFEHVTVKNYIDCGFSIEQRSATHITFRSCWFLGEGRGLTGLATHRGLCEDGSGRNCGGSFVWLGGGGGGNRGSDFQLGDSEGTILISGAQFEGSARFLHTGGPSGAAWPVTVESVVWIDDMLGQFENSPWPAHEQHHIVKFQFRGPLTITGCKFGEMRSEYGTAKPSEIIWNPGMNFGQFIFRGNYLASSLDNPFVGVPGLVPSVYPTIQEGNMVEPVGSAVSRLLHVPMKTHVSELTNWQEAPTVGWVKSSRELFTTTAGVDVTDLLHGVQGQRISIRATGERRFVNGASLALRGGEDFVMQAGDALTLVMYEDEVWCEVGRSEAPTVPQAP